MSKSDKKNTVGPWAVKKLNVLDEYLKFYTTALKKRGFELVYIDAFAGSPDVTIRDEGSPPELLRLATGGTPVKPGEKYTASSARRALKFKNSFKRLHFFEKDPTRVKALRDIGDKHDNVEITLGECNSLICDLRHSLMPPSVRGVAFLDPYGANVEWRTLEALASTKHMEVIINFPLGMAINRLTRKDAIKLKGSQRILLDKVFGTDKWFDEVYYKGDSNFWGDAPTKKTQESPAILLQFYLDRLEKLFGYVVDRPTLINCTTGQKLYYLIWAGPDKLGKKGADHIFGNSDEGKTFSRPKNRSKVSSDQATLDI